MSAVDLEVMVQAGQVLLVVQAAGLSAVQAKIIHRVAVQLALPLYFTTLHALTTLTFTNFTGFSVGQLFEGVPADGRHVPAIMIFALFHN